jgi:NAD(P)-dependent dehydrogenase (short-subunit alcohol dehydrogenase family)
LFTPSLVELPRPGQASRLLEEPTRVLVIGALGGIGSTWAEALLREGHQVIGTSRQDRASLVVGREARLVALEAHGPAFQLLRYDPKRDSPAAILAAASRLERRSRWWCTPAVGWGTGCCLDKSPSRWPPTSRPTCRSTAAGSAPPESLACGASG